MGFGVTLDAIDNLGTYFQRAGYLLLALWLLLLAPTLGRIRHGWRWLSLLARLEAAALVAWVLTDVAQTGATRYITAIAAGLILGPALTILAGHALATRQSVQNTDAPESRIVDLGCLDVGWALEPSDGWPVALGARGLGGGLRLAAGLWNVVWSLI